MRRFWPALDLPVVLAILICCMMGYAARYNLNPDGVSYLDLVAIFRSGDFGHFVQGYWSPLYPILLAGVQVLSGASDAGFLPWVHGFDTLLIVLTILIIWYSARRSNNLIFGLAGTSTVLLASGRLPRVETVTPDLLLALILTAIACEMLSRGGSRWLWLGVLFGLAFLAKTSSWPWMIAAMVVSLIFAGGRAARLNVLRVGGVGAVVILCWVVPLSIKYASPTLGSSGRLNYCWYIRSCDSRTPDTHTGEHERYVDTTIATGVTIRVARYDDGPWSYQPWGDPTAWDRGITGGYTYTPSQPWILSVWGDLSPLLYLWTISVTIGILLPLFLVMSRRGMFNVLVEQEAPAILLMFIGIVGIGQFVVVHAEPRLIAPFVLVGGLGVVHWLSRLRTTLAVPDPHPTRRIVLGVTGGWLWAMVLGYGYLNREFFYAKDDLARLDGLLSSMHERAPNAGPHPRIVLIGPAGRLMADVWKAGGRVVAQVIRPSLADIDTWPGDRRQALLNSLLQYRPDVIWVTMPDKSLVMIPVVQK